MLRMGCILAVFLALGFAGTAGDRAWGQAPEPLGFVETPPPEIIETPPAEPLARWPIGEWLLGATEPPVEGEFLETPPPPEMGEEWLFPHSPPANFDRHRGYGHPLRGTSWRNRPWHVGWMAGALWGDELIADEVHQHQDFLGGFRFGYDADHFWGWEGRWSFAEANLDNGVDPPSSQSVEAWFSDGNLLLYPWGDSQWRPYVSIGAGLAHFRFTDADDVLYDQTLFQIPLGVGAKYLHNRWLALRFDLTHHITFGAGDLETMDNVSATLGLEFHFGAKPRSYYPY